LEQTSPSHTQKRAVSYCSATVIKTNVLKLRCVINISRMSRVISESYTSACKKCVIYTAALKYSN